MSISLRRYLPILEWGRDYDRPTLSSDLVAAVVVTIMLIPQSLAYATLAGLPPQMGLYASIAPLIAYAVFGTSRTMAIGPVAVVSLMTASAVAAGRYKRSTYSRTMRSAESTGESVERVWRIDCTQRVGTPSAPRS